MTGEERSRNFWQIRSKNIKREKRKEILKRLKDNSILISLAASSIIALLIVIGFGFKANPKTTVNSATIKKEPIKAVMMVNNSKCMNESTSTKTLGIDYSKRIQYQSLTFRNINVRKSPDINSDIVSEIPQNTFVDVLEDKGDWIKILHDGSPAYVKSDYIGTIMEYKKFNSIGKKTFTNVNARTGPSEDSESAFILDAGTDVNFVKSENGWSEILYNDQIYYIKSDYIGDEDGYKEYQANLDKTPYSDYLIEKYGFSKDLQRYTYNLCKEFYPADPEHYYTFLLAVMQQESDFGRDRSNYNKNGSRDLGIMQVNSCNWRELKKKG